MMKKYFLLLLSSICFLFLTNQLKTATSSFPYAQYDHGPYKHYTLQYIEHIIDVTKKEGSNRHFLTIDKLKELSCTVREYESVADRIHNFYTLHAKTVTKIKAKKSQLQQLEDTGKLHSKLPIIKLDNLSSEISQAIQNFNTVIQEELNNAKKSGSLRWINSHSLSINRAYETIERLAKKTDQIIAEIDASAQKTDVTAAPTLHPAFKKFSASSPAPSVPKTSSSSFSQRNSSSSSSSSFTFDIPSSSSSNSSSSSSFSSTQSSWSSSKSSDNEETSLKSVALGSTVIGMSVASIEGGRLFHKTYKQVCSQESDLNGKDAAIKALKESMAEVTKNPLQHKVLVFSSMLGILSAAACLLK